MACFITIQKSTELRQIAQSLTLAPFYHKHVADIRITDPFRARKKEWEEIRVALKRGADAVFVSMFIEQDMPTAAYLLAPFRGLRDKYMHPVKIKVGLIVKPNSPFNPAVLKGTVDLVRIPSLQPDGCAQLREKVLEILPRNAVGDIFFVDDQQSARDRLRSEMTPAWFGGRRVQVVEFDDAHALLLEQTLPAAIVTDTIEVVNRPQYDHTGLGLYLIVRSTPRLQEVTPILFSMRLFDDLNDPSLSGGLMAFDDVFVDDRDIEIKIDIFLKEVWV